MPYASPAYLAAHGEPQHPEELAAHECLLFGPAQANWTLMRGGETIEAKVGGRYRFNSVGMMHRMAVLGIGVGLLADQLTSEDVATGHLRRLMPDWQAMPVPVHAVTETRLIPAKTQRFMEFLSERLSGPIFDQ